MKKTLAPLAGSFLFLYAARFFTVPGGSFIGAITGAALVRLLYPSSKSPPERLQNFARLVLGLTIGIQVNREAALAAASAALPVAFMVVSLIALSLFAALLAARFSGMDLVTALCGAAPGAASAMVILAKELGGEAPVVAVIHSVKILLFVAFMPLLAGLFPSDAGSAVFPAASAAGEGLFFFYVKLVFLAAGGLVLSKLMRKAGFPTAEFLAGLFFAAVCNPFFLNIAGFPSLWQFFAVWIVGASIGSQMNRDSLFAIKKYASVCIVLVLVLAALGLVLGWVLYAATSMGPLTALIGTCPTGMDAMVILAAEMGTNVPLVAAMHSARVIMVMVVVPLLVRRTTGRGKKAPL